MLQFVWLALGGLAFATTLGTITRRLDVPTRTIAALFGAVLWGLWGVSAANVQVVTDGGVQSFSYEALTIVGLLVAVMHGLFFLRTGLSALQGERAV
jgi:hypothetical protein